MKAGDRNLAKIKDYLKARGLAAFMPVKPVHVAYLTHYFDELHIGILWEEMNAFMVAMPQGAFIVGAHEHWAGPPDTGVAPAWLKERIPGGTDGYETLKILTDQLKSRGLGKGRIGIETKWLPFEMHRALREYLPDAEFVPANDLVPQMRLVKSDRELQMLKKAAEAGLTSMDAYMQAIRRGAGEKEALLIRAKAALDCGAEWLDGAYRGAWTGGPDHTPDWWSPEVQERFKRCPDRYWHGIVDSPDFCVTHFETVYQGYFADLAWHEFIREPRPGALLDFGDGAKVSVEEAREDFDILRRMQTDALSAIRPGMSHFEALEQVRNRVASDAEFAAHCTGYFIHGVGLEIHEEPVFTSVTAKPIPQNERIVYEIGAVVSSEWFSKYWTVEEPFVLTATGWQPLVHRRGLRGE